MTDIPDIVVVPCHQTQQPGERHQMALHHWKKVGIELNQKSYAIMPDIIIEKTYRISHFKISWKVK